MHGYSVYHRKKKNRRKINWALLSFSLSLCPLLSVTLREELRVCVHMCMCVHECVWEVDRFPTWKWLAIIRCSVTRGYVRQLKLCFFNRDMIHAACSNSNHLQARQKPDADKGWRNQCRLTAALLPIPSAFQSGHLGYQERRLLLILGLFCLLGLPDKSMCLELDTGKSRLREL